ncbi:hypothetical protein NB717_002663 [Xanthomonas sacchari]|nr:hypothetical protein [Xanthomonas sacchari]
MRTPPGAATSDSLPLTRLPEAGASTACACCTVPALASGGALGGGGGGAFGGALLHAASINKALAARGNP